MTLSVGSPAARELLARYYEAEAETLGVSSNENFLPRVSTKERRRRRSLDAGADGTSMMVLMEEDDVLHWEIGAHPVAQDSATGAGGRRGSGLRSRHQQHPVVELPFELLPPNAVIEAIQKLDVWLAAKLDDRPAYGLRRWQDGKLVPVARPQAGAGQRVLLFVHGTFSNCDQMFRREFLSSAEGRSLVSEFDEVLTFDHPTLAVSPVLNAYELACATQGTSAEVCTVAHSRGGLVTRWWLEAFGGASHGPRRAVLVGSPAAGTSLASPSRIRESLDLLTNIGNALKLTGAAAASYAPFLAAPVVLLKVFASVSSALGRFPIPDAGIALVPGLSGQSRAGNNPELLRLRAAKPVALPRYAVIQSNFEPEDVAWKFWKAFRKENLANLAADRLFPGANDLVVDCDSMSDFFADTSIAKPTIAKGWDPSPKVHHLNYFEQPETIAAIRDSFSMTARLLG